MKTVNAPDIRTTANIITDYLAMGCFWILWFGLFYNSYFTLFSSQTYFTSFLIILFSMILGMFSADLASGLAHFLADTFGDENTPYFGKRWIKPFRDHHGHPTDIIEHYFTQLNGKSAMLCIVFFLVPTLFFGWGEHNLVSLFFQSSILIFTAAIVFTNSIHRWAHMENPPSFIKLLQRYHIILSFEEHQLHHTAPHDSYFCITTGWLNNILNRILDVGNKNHATQNTKSIS